MASTTKAYLLSLLLLFLLVHTSARILLPMPVLRKLSKPLYKFFNLPQRANKVPRQEFPPLKKSKYNPPNPPSPPDAASPPEKIDNLSLVKEYLNSYGYMPDSKNFTDLLDEQAISSIQEYQQFFNLNVTGYPDNDTIEQMSLLRCAVPDKNLTYDLPTDNVSWPLGTQWFFPKGRMNLTYGFAPKNELPKNVTKVFEDSFKGWSDAIGVVNLTETTSYDAADIKIGFYIFEDNQIGPEVVGGSYIKLESGNNNDSLPNYPNNVTSGYMVLVYNNMSWALPDDNIIGNMSWEYDVVDLETVVMHQIGHLLGLQHSSNEDSVMYPAILLSMQRKVNLSENDKEMINRVYSSTGISGCGCVILFGSGWGLVTTSLSLGFACMVLFI